MAEKMNVGLEKVFLHWILDNPDQFQKVEPFFFDNDDIQFVYHVVREEYLISRKVPDPQQILAMVKLNDADGRIANNIIKSILKGDNSSYDDDWINPRFKSWKLAKATKNNVMQSIEFIRGLDIIDYDNVSDVASKIQNIFNESKMIDDDDDDLGEDFDDPESHQITNTSKKMSTGWSTIDKIMTGGWDQASMNVLMGETNVGKCSVFDTIITIKRNNIEEEISIGEFFERIKNG